MRYLEICQPTLHITCLGTEFNADLYDLTFVRLERFCISFLLNLLEGFFGCTIQFEFEDVDIIFSLHHGIRTTFLTVHLSLSWKLWLKKTNFLLMKPLR